MIPRQDFFALIPYYLGYSRIRNSIFRLRKKSITRFLAFHDIQPESFSNFKANMHFLKQRTNVISLDDFFSGRLSLKKINVVITFDDGYKSWITYALPILKALELPATFFITSGFVGLSKEDEASFLSSKLSFTPTPQSREEGLDDEDIRKIVGEGFAIGGHTLNHCILGHIRDRKQVEHEIVDDKMRLERISGVNIKYFAYPSGEYCNPEIDLVEVLKETGYRGAVTTVAGHNKIGSAPYLLHRELTRASMPKPVFKARVYGNNDAVRFIKKWTHKFLREQ